MAGKKRVFSEIMGPPENPDETKHQEVIFEDAKKNLLESFNKSQATSAPDPAEHMKVYLRVRPFSADELARDEDQKCLELETDQSVVAHAPKESHTFRHYTHGLGKTNHKFTFSRIFGQETSQKEFFDETMLGLARDFIDGQNCLVFTYGVTSSGKTYTIQGKPQDAGLLPRALDVLFNSISGKQWPGMTLKPKMFTDVKMLSAEEENKEKKIKEKTLRMSSDDDCDVMTLLGEDASDVSQGNTTTASEGSNVSTVADHHKDSVDGDLFAELENRVREEAAVSVEDQGQIRFSIWVSFAEIYNEQIFDLLEPLPKKKNARRQVLKLSEDKHGSPYIKGLKEINVTSADEAYRLLTIGQKNLKTACTKLNHNSSRRLSLCDLAGSERQSKTHSGGERLKEAGNINTSLMTLGRCIEFLRYNQAHRENPKMVPFRDSKLTRLFQNFFSGRGKAAMIVNVNQCASMFDETLNVFKFSAIAKQVVVVQKPEPKPKLPRLHPKRDANSSIRPSISWASPGTILKYSSDMNMTDLTEEDQELDLDSSGNQVDELLNIIEHLQQELQAERKDKIRHEAKIREEVCKEMMTQLVQLETDYTERLREREIQAEEMVEERVKILMANQPPCKRPRQDKMVDDEDEWVSSVLLHAEQVKVKERDEEIKKLKAELSKQKSEVMKGSKLLEGLTKEKTACEFALADRTRTIQELKGDKLKAVSQLHEVENELEIAKQTNTALQKQLRQTKRESVEYSLQKELDVANGRIEDLQNQLRQALASGSDVGNNVLLETLSQQLQAAKETQKKQEHEITELNEMLTEAGETFQQKGEEISKLKSALADDEERINQQAEAIEKLQQALQESKHAVEDNELRLQRKNERIATLVEEKKQIQDENDELVKKVEELQAELDTSKPEATEVQGSEVTATLAEKEAELEKLKARLKREEEDAMKRDQALIHGYNAEISSYKAQVSELKCKLREARGLSPQRSPRKTPKKTPQKDKDEDESFKNHLLKQIKDFQEELDRNSSVVFDLKQSLTIAQESASDLEKKLEIESNHHIETKIALSELKGKLKQVVQERDNTEFQMKEQETNLKYEMEKSREDMKQKEEKLSQLEVAHAELRCRFETLTDEKSKLDSEKENMLEVISAKDDLIIGHVNVRESLKEKVEELEGILKEKEEEMLKLEQTSEELRMLNTELKQMLNASTNQQESLLIQKLESKDKESEEKLSALKKEQNHILAENEEKVKVMKFELAAVREKYNELESKFDQAEENLVSANREVSQIMVQKDQELQVKVNKINELVTEIESLRKDTAEQTKKSENVEDVMMKLKNEMEAKSTDVNEWKKKCELSENEIKDLKAKLLEEENKNKELSTSLEELKTDHCMSLQQVRCELEQAQKILLENEQTLSDEQSKSVDVQATVQAQTEQINFIKKQLEEKSNDVTETKLKLGEATRALDHKNDELCSLKENLKCLEERTKQQQKDLKMQLSELQTELSTKDHELEQVRSTYLDMQEKLTSSDAKLSQLSEASLEIAELKSALHMEKTLHLKYKQDLETAREEKDEVDAALKKTQGELDQVQKGKDDIEESLKQCQEDLKQCQEDLKQCQEDLKQARKNKDDAEASLTQVQVDLKEAERLKAELEAQLQKVEEELNNSLNGRHSQDKELKNTEDKYQVQLKICEDLRKEVCKYEQDLNTAVSEKSSVSDSFKSVESEKDKLKQELESVKQRENKLKMELDSAKGKWMDLEKEVNRLSTMRSNNKDVNMEGGSPNTRLSGVLCDTADIQKDLELEKRKNQELQQIVDSIKTEEDLAPGSARRLRKGKIEAECALVNASYEIKRLQRQLERSQGSTIVMSPTKTTDSDLCRRLEDSEIQMEALTRKHKQCVDELSECRAKVVMLQAEVEKVRDELAEKKQEVLNLIRDTEKSSKESSSSSSTTSTTSMDTFVHEQLQKSQDREKNLRQQLQQASDSMKENIDKISELEEQLTSAQHTLHEMEDKMSVLQREKEKLMREQTSFADLKQEVTQLRADLDRKSEKLEVKSTALKDLKRSQESERERFEVALRDAKANENVIEQLKMALTDQEETMAAQDKVLSNKDEEIKTLSEELDKMTERYRQMLDQRGDSSRELRDVMKSLTKAEAERDEMKREVEKLTAERNQKEVIIRENNHELKDLERSLLEKRQEIVNLKSSVEKEVQKHVEEKKCETSTIIDELKMKVREKDHDLRKVEKEIGKYEEMLKEMRQKVADKDQELVEWREHRDKLVGSLETLMRKQAAEIKELKQEREAVHIKDEMTSLMEEKELKIQELQEKVLNMEHMLTNSQSKPTSRGRKRSTLHANPDLDIIKRQLDQEREDKLQLQHQMKLLQKANDQIVADLKMSNTSLQVQVAALQGVPPPPKPPRMDPSFVNDDDTAQGHQQMDATPPIAAKAIKKSGRKRNQDDPTVAVADQTPKTKRGRGRPAQVKKEIEPVDENLMTVMEDDESTSRPSRKAKKAAKGKIGDIVTATAHSPVTRSDWERITRLSSKTFAAAKKFVGNIVDDGQSEPVKVEEEPETTSKRGRRGKRALYKEEVSAPFDCAPFVPVASNKVDVHNVVQKRLRGRKTTNSTDV